MKKVIILLSALAALAGCAKGGSLDSEEEMLSKEFEHTGCSSETKGFYTNDPSLLKIKYEQGDLRVTLTNAELNCAFKELGFKCKASIEGNVIHYDVVYEKDEQMVANCFCLVEQMTSAVAGLEKEELHKIFDVESLYNIVSTE